LDCFIWFSKKEFLMPILDQVILVMIDIVHFLIFHANHSLWLFANICHLRCLSFVVTFSQNHSGSFNSAFVVKVWQEEKVGHCFLAVSLSALRQKDLLSSNHMNMALIISMLDQKLSDVNQGLSWILRLFFFDAKVSCRSFFQITENTYLIFNILACVLFRESSTCGVMEHFR